MAPKAKPKTVLDKVCAAIEALATPGGASRVAIAKAVTGEHGAVSAVLLKKALAAGAAAGRLEQRGQRFALVGVEVAARAEERVEKEVLKQGSGDAVGAGNTVVMSYEGTLQAERTDTGF